MITRENLPDVIKLISGNDKERIHYSFKEYTVLILHTFNSGSTVEVHLTDDLMRWQKVKKNGNAILPTEEVKPMLKGLI